MEGAREAAMAAKVEGTEIEETWEDGEVDENDD